MVHIVHQLMLSVCVAPVQRLAVPTTQVGWDPAACHSLRARKQTTKRVHGHSAADGGRDHVNEAKRKAKNKLDEVVNDVEDRVDDNDSAGAMQELVGPAR